MTPTSTDQIVMMALGAAAMIAGLTLLRFRPSAVEAGSDDEAGGADAPVERRPPLGLSEPTRLVISVVLLVVGYHAVMWALPARWASVVALPRDRWYLLAAGAVVVVLASLVLDWAGRRRRDE